MDTEFSYKKSNFQKAGDAAVFRSHVAELRRNNRGFSPTLSLSREPSSALEFWGQGADLVSIFNQVDFIVACDSPGRLNLSVSWLPATRRGAQKLAWAGTKGAVKKGGKHAVKTAIDTVATAGVLEAQEVAETTFKAGKGAVKAMRKAANIDTTNNLKSNWLVRIRVGQDSAAPCNNPDGSPNFNLETIPEGWHSKQLAEQIIKQINQFSFDAMNFVKKHWGGTHYDSLADVDDAEQIQRELAAAAGNKKGKVEKVRSWLSKLPDLPSRRRGFHRIGGDEIS